MKKITALLLALLTLLSFAACDGKENDTDNPSGDNGTSEESGKSDFRLPENVKYTYKSPDGDYTNITVTKIKDEICIENNGQITFYRKNADGQYDYWLKSGDGWMYLSAFNEEMLEILFGISTVGIDYDSIEKTGTASVCGLSADVYKSKYLQNNETYIHSGKDGVFVVKTVVGSTVIEITEWTTENVRFEVEKPE